MTVLHQIIQGVERLFDRRCRVETVQLIEIDMIELHAAQALFDAVNDVIARTAARIDARRAGFAEDFGSDDHIFTRDLKIFQRLAGDLLRAPFRINVGGVDKVNSGIQRATNQLFRIALLKLTNFPPHAAFTAKGHGAEAQFRNKQTGIAQFLITHMTFLTMFV
ncbi:hypothetical protein D3C87_1590850 [compost metagenome]